ncbi:Methyltransferase [Lachnellula hyalina]|uniref:Methyltransferase n=1 Tax=Lachnellula hyalina TaxID=1316788 RepID=A0A8H8QTP0_9HELO|nr:Methyltransferase [Lachnellula hyalina]TVY22559.1 Methyltransferase [Lachnellula hyalina]
MNAPEGTSKFVPKQALAPTPQLYDELVGDSMEQLAKASLAQISPIPFGSVIHDNGCGTGAGTAAVVEAIAASKAEVSIKGTDINEKALEVYRKHAAENKWPAEAEQMDSLKLSIADNTFTLTIGNAFLFVLPNDGIDAVKEMYRTLKPGGKMLVNSWAYVPNMEPLQTAAKATRPPGTPLPREGMAKWAPADFVQNVVEKGGFEKDKIVMKKAEVYCTTTELTHFATMLWSFIGGTSEVGWLESDEANWDKAINVVKEELAKTDGYKAIDGGRAQLKFVANIAIATK